MVSDSRAVLEQWNAKEQDGQEDPSQAGEALSNYQRILEIGERCAYSRITLTLRPRDSSIREAKGNDVLRSHNEYKAFGRDDKVSVHGVRNDDGSHTTEAGTHQAEAYVDDGPVELLLTSKANHEQACEDHGHDEDEQSQSRLRLEETVVASRLTLSPNIGHYTTNDAAYQISD